MTSMNRWIRWVGVAWLACLFLTGCPDTAAREREAQAQAAAKKAAAEKAAAAAEKAAAEKAEKAKAKRAAEEAEAAAKAKAFRASLERKKRTRGPEDLANAKEVLEACAADPSPARVDACWDVLSDHYVGESTMAGQADYFVSYADLVIAQLEACPELAKSKLSYYYGYLVTDLQDTGEERLMKRGRKLAGLLK